MLRRTLCRSLRRTICRLLYRPLRLAYADPSRSLCNLCTVTGSAASASAVSNSRFRRWWYRTAPMPNSARIASSRRPACLGPRRTLTDHRRSKASARRRKSSAALVPSLSSPSIPPLKHGASGRPEPAA